MGILDKLEGGGIGCFKVELIHMPWAINPAKLLNAQESLPVALLVPRHLGTKLKVGQNICMPIGIWSVNMGHSGFEPESIKSNHESNASTEWSFECQ